MAYLKVYAEAMRDGDITEREKSMLAAFAASYGLDEERVVLGGVSRFPSLRTDCPFIARAVADRIVKPLMQFERIREWACCLKLRRPIDSCLFALHGNHGCRPAVHARVFRWDRLPRFSSNGALQNQLQRHAAERCGHFGFGFNPNHAWNGTVMSGTLNGYRCRIWFETVRRRSRRNRSASIFTPPSPSMPPNNLVWRSPPKVCSMRFQLPDRLTGNQDIVVGQEAFDSMYRVKVDEAAVRAHLTPPRVQAILQTQQSLGTLSACSSPTRRSRFDFPA